MTSNTKVTRDEKLAVKLFKQTHPQCKFYHFEDMTILMVPRDSVFLAFSAVLGEDEKKYRKSVGEYYCLRRYDMGAGFVIRNKGRGVGVSMDTMAYKLATSNVW